jgi:hypothetical protein
MVIKIKDDEGQEVMVSKEDVVTWMEAVELFVNAIRGLGYNVHDFSFRGGDVFDDWDWDNNIPKDDGDLIITFDVEDDIID